MKEKSCRASQVKDHKVRFDNSLYLIGVGPTIIVRECPINVCLCGTDIVFLVKIMFHCFSLKVFVVIDYYKPFHFSFIGRSSGGVDNK